MKLKDFNFELPSDLIAFWPSERRTESKLLVLGTSISDHKFNDLPSFLGPEDILVINDSAVIKARLKGKKASGAKVEILVERIIEENLALALTRSNSKLRVGDKILLSNNGPCLTIQSKEQTLSKIKFSEPVRPVLHSHGEVPLPPYIRRKATESDISRYQTVYANFNKANSVAAPTAGLHFDDELMSCLKDQGTKFAKITLDVGLGTFNPIKTDLIKNHVLHNERIEIKEESVDLINETKSKGGRVVCVGTTSMRCIESVSLLNKGKLEPFKGETDLFIKPGFKFHIADALITNFHLPFSSLLVLVSAFAGHKRILSAYEHAVRNLYRFYSYGDAMFIHPEIK